MEMFTWLSAVPLRIADLTSPPNSLRTTYFLFASAPQIHDGFGPAANGSAPFGFVSATAGCAGTSFVAITSGFCVYRRSAGATGPAATVVFAAADFLIACGTSGFTTGGLSAA